MVDLNHLISSDAYFYESFKNYINKTKDGNILHPSSLKPLGELIADTEKSVEIQKYTTLFFKSLDNLATVFTFRNRTYIHDTCAHKIIVVPAYKFDSWNDLFSVVNLEYLNNLIPNTLGYKNLSLERFKYAMVSQDYFYDKYGNVNNNFFFFDNKRVTKREKNDE